MPRLLLHLLALVLSLVSAGASAHDPSAYGGLFRSRDLGATWLNADIGLFLNAALTVAVDPRDPAHLLMGTDLGLLRSRSGGQSWTPERQTQIIGAVFALAFSPDGQTVLCAAPSGVFRFHDGEWTRADAPQDAAPARALAMGAAPGRVYLLGRRGLFRSDDGGRSYDRIATTLPAEAEITALAVATSSSEIVHAVIDGALMASEDGGETRRGEDGSSTTVSIGAPPRPSARRVWAAGADRVHRSDDLGLTWRAVGQLLPEPGTTVRGIAADPAARTLVVTTHRGMYRSEDGGASWALKEDNLPVHLEAGPLARDRSDALVLYAVYSLLPYGEVWRTALEGGNLLARTDPVSLAGGLAFLLLLIIGGTLLARWLARQRAAGTASGAWHR